MKTSISRIFYGLFVTLLTLSARAQQTGVLIAQSVNQGSSQNQITSASQILQISMPQKSLGRKLLDNTTLNYYHQFLGPTAGGPANQTYNVFQEGLDSPGTGYAPYQSFQAVNLRHQISFDWAIGATLSAVNGHTSEVQNVDDQAGKQLKDGVGDGTRHHGSCRNVGVCVCVCALLTPAMHSNHALTSNGPRLPMCDIVPVHSGRGDGV
jgi:hypothetical protein